MEKDAKACQAFKGQRCTLNRGKVLGGTSSINDMRYMRGTVYNYDRMGYAVLNSNISYSIFQKIEGYERDEQEELQFTYGTKGPIFLDASSRPSDIKDLLRYSYRATGYSRIPRRKFLGFTDQLVYIRNGERFNMAKAFLSPIKERPNLFFTKNTEVEGLVLNQPRDRRVNGVNVSISGIRFFIRARKEVVLAAGPINNAKLLLVSGIGPRPYLERRGISVVTDVPAVGKSLIFHITVPLYVSIEPCCNRPKDYYREIELIGDVFDYLMRRTGNLSHTGINHIVAYISARKTGATWPNLAIYHKYFKIGDRDLMAWLDGMDYHDTIRKTLITTNKEKAILLFMVSLLEPISRGEVSLNDTHYLSNPMIKPNFFTDDENLDFERLLSGFNFVTNLTGVSEMKEYNAEFLDLNVPNCRNFKFCTMAYVRCYITNMAYPAPDLVGGAKIGEECDASAVVTKNLEVKQVRCLRVADSSVLSEIPIGSTVATDAMIGYNLGEILKEKWIKNYTSPFHNVVHEQKEEDVQD